MQIRLNQNRLIWGAIRAFTAISLALSWVVAIPASPAYAANNWNAYKSVGDGVREISSDVYQILYIVHLTQEGGSGGRSGSGCS